MESKYSNFRELKIQWTMDMSVKFSSTCDKIDVDLV